MTTPAQWVRPAIRALSAYHVPPAAGLIKLDAMENPYGWPPALVEAWLGRLRQASLNRYPDPQATALKAQLRQAMAVPDAAGLILGNGSDELIQLILLAVAEPGRVVLAPDPTFVMYRLLAAATGMDYRGVALRAADFALDGAALLAAVERQRPAVVFLASPNNPTGNLFDPDVVRAVIDAAPGLVVVDEAYCAFTDRSVLPDVGRWPNLLVMRTLSKMGLAGLRLGLLAGPPAWLDELEKVRLPYNINVLTQLSAEFALSHGAVLEDQARRIRADRARLFAALQALPGIVPYPSEANFILFRTPPGAAQRLFQTLAGGGVLVKNLSRGGGLLRDCLRVTVGAPDENRRFLEVLGAAL
ncbi:MAG: histidinol-phosphate transaminase [Pseudomonadota bacterium]|nr:histidinol-phosphate transaminase [Pseudomonadota bacterium]